MHDHQEPVSINIDIVDAFHHISVRHVETNVNLEWQWIRFSWREPFLYFAFQNEFSNADSLSWSFLLEKVDLSVSTGSYSWTNFVPKWVENVFTKKMFVARKKFVFLNLFFDPYDSSLERAICRFSHLLHLEPAFSLPLSSNLLQVCSAWFACSLGLPFS